MAITATPWTRMSSEQGSYNHPQIIDLGDTYISIYQTNDVAGGHPHWQYDLRCSFSTDLVTWTNEITIVTPPSGSIYGFPAPMLMNSGRIIVWLMKRSNTTLAFESNGYVYSDDGGDRWSDYIEHALPVARIAGSPLPLRVGDTYYLPHYVDATSQNHISIYAVDATGDGTTYTSVSTPHSDGVMEANYMVEPSLTYHDGLFVLACRNNGQYATGERGLWVSTAADLAGPWNGPARVNVTGNLWLWTHPCVHGSGGRFWLWTADRDSVAPAGFADDKLWLFSSTAARLSASANDWDLEASFARPVESPTYSNIFYGYPILYDHGDGRMHISVRGAPSTDETEYYATFSGFPAYSRILSVTGANWSFMDTTVTCTLAPVGERTTAMLTVYSSVEGAYAVSSTPSRFAVSLDGLDWRHAVNIPAGTTQVHISVIPEIEDVHPISGEGTLTARLGLPKVVTP